MYEGQGDLQPPGQWGNQKFPYEQIFNIKAKRDQGKLEWIGHPHKDWRKSIDHQGCAGTSFY